MKVAVVGATGLVGREMLKVLDQRKFRFDELFVVASEKSIGTKIGFRGKDYHVIGLAEAVAAKPHIALFSAGGSVSLEWAPKFETAGTVVIDNSSAWRMSPDHKLIVPEINGHELRIDHRIIANPNCSTIQMVLALSLLHKKYKVRRIVVSTYQAVTGTGKKAVDQLMNERKGIEGPMAYPYKIDFNVLPQVDIFLDSGYTKEEMKMVNETKKILGDPGIKVTATTVRVPVLGGHSEAVNVEFYSDYTMDEVRSLISNTPGTVLMDDPANKVYPMPILAEGKDEVFVGRLRRDDTQPNTLNMWIVSDNLRKGAATNAVQIAEYMVEHSLIY
jgi:aspartate-semialdehyde dehydrogenase